MSEDLSTLRNKIDAIDEEILDLLNQRARCAEQVAEVKLKSGDIQAESVAFYRPEREAQILRRIMHNNPGPLKDIAAAQIFREVISACLAHEKPLRIAYLGPEGTFTQQASLKHFGHAVNTVYKSTIDSVFNDVENTNVDYGVVPVENSTEGMVTHTLDSFMNSSLRICGEVELKIALHLLASEQAAEKTITKICAHQQALAQSRSWLNAHWPGVQKIAVASNAEAAKMAADDASIAAVAGEIAAEAYGLHKLADNIQDYSDNTTRFLVIGHDKVPPSGADKTSIIVAAHNKPGALHNLLEPFHRHGITLTRIDSRPLRTQNWAYAFFIEFEGHEHDEQIAEIMAELEEQSVLLKPLGSYPKAVL